MISELTFFTFCLTMEAVVRAFLVNSALLVNSEVSLTRRETEGMIKSDMISALTLFTLRRAREVKSVSLFVLLGKSSTIGKAMSGGPE